MASTLASRQFGEGTPMLFIHGWQMNAAVEEADFEPIFSKLPGFQRIYVDLPGMGATAAHGVNNLDDIYNCLTHFIDTTLGKARFLLVGSSCGGYLARAVAHTYRNQIDGLLLRVPLVEPNDSRRDVDPVQPLIRDDEAMSSLDTDDRIVLGSVLVQSSAYIQALKKKWNQTYLPAIKAADSQAMDPVRSDPQRYKLTFHLDFEHSKILVPTLITCGRQDESVGYRDSLRLLELYPRSTFVILDRAAHDVPVDENARSVFEAMVRDWIFRVNEWRNQTAE